MSIASNKKRPKYGQTRMRSIGHERGAYNTDNVMKLMNETLCWWNVRLREENFPFDFNVVQHKHCYKTIEFVHTDSHNCLSFVFFFLSMNAWMLRMDEKRQSIWPEFECNVHCTQQTHSQHRNMDWNKLENVRIQYFLSFMAKFFHIHHTHILRPHIQSTEKSTANARKNCSRWFWYAQRTTPSH